MFKKFVIFMAMVAIPVLGMAQHLDFFGIPMDKSIDEFEKILLEKGVTKDFWISGDYADYKITSDNQEYKISLHYTKYSKQVYMVSVSFADESYALCEKGYQRLVGRIVTEYNYKQAKKGEKYIKFVGDFGTIDIFKNDGFVQIVFMDTENHVLMSAEQSSFLNWKRCKKLQKKYENPLFYDKNPRFELDRNN
jgi:hypothetical protein